MISYEDRSCCLRGGRYSSGGRGRGGSFFRLCQGLLFGVVALVDFEHCQDHHLIAHHFTRRRALGRGDRVTDDAAADGVSMASMRAGLCIVSSYLFLGDGEFCTEGCECQFQLVKAICDLLRRCSLPLNCLTHATTRQERSSTLLPEERTVLKDGPSSRKNLPRQHPGSGRVLFPCAPCGQRRENCQH